MLDTTATAVFAHPKNITRGEGRVIHVPGLTPGWALPGGRFTESEDEAIRCAMEMNRLIKENTLTTPKADVVTWVEDATWG